MNVVLCLLRGFLLFIGFAWFLGQWYFGVFDLGATIAGVSGILLGGAGYIPRRNILGRSVLVIACGGVVYGEIMRACQYYSKYHMPGNDYPWIIVMFYIGAALCLAGKEVAEWWHGRSG